MTIAILDVPFRDLYIASGGQTVFSVNFPFMSDTYLAVYQRASTDEPDNVTQLLTLGVDYTVTGTGSETGGSITLTNPAAAQDIITILSVEPIDRTSVFNDLNSFTVTLNQQLNDLTIMVKQMDTVLNQLVPKYRIDELVSQTVRPEKLELPILNDGQTWVGQGDIGDSPDNIVAATAFPEELLEVDFVIGTADAHLPNAQVLGSLGSGFLANIDGGATGTLVSRSIGNTANQTTVTNGTGGGNVVIGLSDNLIMPGVQGCEFPKGTTAQRPGGPADGVTRWNTDLLTWEGWDGSTWVDFFTTSTGANINLSNLSTTAINTDLISDTDATDNLGSQAIRWANIYAATLQTGDTAGDTLRLGAWDTNSAVFTPFITITANNTPTCLLADGVEAVTQAALDSSDKVATTQYVDDAVSSGGGGANTALSNLAAVAINASLVSDSDGIDDLGSESNRWLNLYAERITTGETAADALNIGAWDVNGAFFVPFITLTANNVPTCLLQDGVEAITQAPGDNSQKVATTEYVADYLPLAGGTLTGDLILNANPTVALGAATKQYVDAIATGIDIKEPVYAATTGALTATYANGASGVGATLTNSGAQAAFAVDGVSPALNARILVKNQGSTFENGIYTLTTVGSGASNWVLTRATDYDTAAEINTGDLVIVENGTVNAVTGWLETATVVTMGTDPITFSQFAANTGANTALSNLAAVAINTALLSAADNTLDLGSATNRWNDLYATALKTGTTIGNTLTISARDVDGTSDTAFITLTAGNTPTCAFNGDITTTTQSFGDSSTKIATTSFVQRARRQVVNAQTVGYTAVDADLAKVIRYTGGGGVTLALDPAATLADGWFTTLRNDSSGVITINPNGAETINGVATLDVAAGEAVIIYTNGTLFYTVGEASADGANRALSNLASVAINTSLISDTDVTDDLGTLAIRWKDIFAQTLNTGDTAADTLKLRGYDVDGTAFVDFLTITAGNTPTCALASSVTGVTQSANDNSTKLATTAYADAVGASGGSLTLIATSTAASSATVDFSNNLSATYDNYMVVMENVVPATNAVTFLMRIGTGAGPTYQATNYIGSSGYFTNASAGGGTTDAGGHRLTIASRHGNSATNGAGGCIYLHNVNNASNNKPVSGQITYYDTSVTAPMGAMMGSSWQGATVLTSLRFIMSSGNISTGTFKLYGIKN